MGETIILFHSLIANLSSAGNNEPLGTSYDEHTRFPGIGGEQSNS
jgi:hypothetical protein